MMVSGGKAWRRPSGRLRSPAARSAAGSTHGPSGINEEVDVPFGSSLTTRAQMLRSCAAAGTDASSRRREQGC